MNGSTSPALLEAAEAVSHLVAGMTEDDWIEDEVKQGAVMYRLIIIGEAAARLPREFRERHPKIEWADIVGFRNFAVHAYFSVSWPMVWVTAIEDVPALAAQVARHPGRGRP